MEIKFQSQKRPIPVSKAGKSKLRNGANKNNKFVGVRQRPSGRWVAEIKDTTQKIRMWLGTFETAEEAARAYDEAACLLRGSNTRTNFITQVSRNSPLASRIRNILDSRKVGDNKVKKPIAKSSPLCLSSISSISRSSSSTSNSEVVSAKTEKIIDTQLFDDAYKPDLSNCIDEYELGGGFGNGYDRHAFNQELVDLTRNDGVTNDMEISDFNRINMERQISASLYSMNGGPECLETFNDCAEAFWDLPPLCSLMFQ